MGRKLSGFLVHAHCCFRIAKDCAQVGVWLGKPRPVFLHTHQVNSSAVMEAQGRSLRPPAAPPDPYPAPGLSPVLVPGGLLWSHPAPEPCHDTARTYLESREAALLVGNDFY